MAEYIERETAIAWFMPYAHAGESIDADVVISDIKGMKTADVAPVVHGRWILGKDLPYSWGKYQKINIIYIALNVQNKPLTAQKIMILILM